MEQRGLKDAHGIGGGEITEHKAFPYADRRFQRGGGAPRSLQVRRGHV